MIARTFLHVMPLCRDSVFFDAHLNLRNLLFLYTWKQGWFFKVFVQVLLAADLSPLHWTGKICPKNRWYFSLDLDIGFQGLAAWFRGQIYNPEVACFVALLCSLFAAPHSNNSQRWPAKMKTNHPQKGLMWANACSKCPSLQICIHKLRH